MPRRQKRVAPPPRSQAHNSAERAPTDADLIVAASSGRLDVVVALLEAGVSALAVDETGKTSLHKAAYLNLTQMARELIAREPAIVAACDVAHNTALHVAAWAGNLSMCAALLEAMAAVSATDLAGNTPLHHAALEGHTAIGEILLVHGASANAPGLEGSTPLHFVALSMTDAKLSFARLLLRHAADPQIPNRHGMTASRLALDQGNDELAQLLLVLAQPDQHAQPAPSPAEAPQKALDVFGCLLRSLAAKELNEELSVFHRSHRHKFLRHPMGHLKEPARQRPRPLHPRPPRGASHAPGPTQGPNRIRLKNTRARVFGVVGVIPSRRRSGGAGGTGGEQMSTRHVGGGGRVSCADVCPRPASFFSLPGAGGGARACRGRLRTRSIFQRTKKHHRQGRAATGRNDIVTIFGRRRRSGAPLEP